MLWLLLAALQSQQVLALPSDRQQPIHVSSDSAERDETKGITTYNGDVEMVQGTLKILASRVVIRSEGNRISSIVATGKPAQYQQIPGENRQLIIARGERIEYSIKAEKLQLSKNASLQQSDGTIMTGDNIVYDIKAAIVRAGSSDKSTERIYMVIPPKPEDEAPSQ